ncbi:MAG: hypothetical protein J2P50_11815 [Hyphomicrobiaceae bacterium]|nr:hypothetical protein [Hyphomicrobiaceae bacterium]
MTDTWPTLYLAGLGAFHGLNPAMGWLFAVALGLNRQSRATVFAALVPIAIGHALSIAVVAGLLVIAGVLVPGDAVRVGAALLLLAWSAYHWRYGHRHRVRFGMQTGLFGLAAWSFLMATAHGAGIMLWPALMSSCLPDSTGAASFSVPIAAASVGVGVHTLAMLATTALVALLVYEWAGVGILRRAWLNVDALWTLALAATAGLVLAY